jgi:hypothetical protein
MSRCTVEADRWIEGSSSPPTSCPQIQFNVFDVCYTVGEIGEFKGLGQEMKAQTERSRATFTAEDLTARAIHRRAFEAVIWGMPAVNFDLMLRAMTGSAKGKPNQIVYWSRLPDWKNQMLTPNPDSIYLMPFFDTKDVGPVVLEIPPADNGEIVGSIDDCWQTALEDVGPAGADKGKGGKYVILPPGYRDKLPKGYLPQACGNYQSYALLRSILKSMSDKDVAAAVNYARGIKVYPLSSAANPPKTKYVDAIDIVFDATIPYDVRFFQSLDRMVQYEPWLDRDRAMIDSLKTIGIKKGQAFNPDARTKEILNAAATEAHAYLDLLYDNAFDPFDKSASWALPATKELAEGIQTNYARMDEYPTDGRGLAYNYAFFSAKHLGAGQYYLMTNKDKAGKHLDGAATYRLRVPANPPVKQYWSATVYDGATHALIRDKKWSSRSSNSPGLQKNLDGSMDVYFAPKAPAGKESNWVPTNSSGAFEVIFRLYGPEKSFFEKKWILPDIEKL